MFVAKLEKLPVVVIALILIFLPLISLPWTPEQIDLNKQMFLYTVVPLLGISLVMLSFLKPKAIKFSILDVFVAMFCLSFLISGILAVGNKWEGVTTESLPMLSLLALYILIRQISSQNNSLLIIGLVVSASVSSLIVLGQKFINPNFVVSPLASQTTNIIWHPAGSFFATLWLIVIALPLSLGLIISAFRKFSTIAIFSKILSIIIFSFLIITVVLLSRPLFSLNPASLPPFAFLGQSTGWKVLLQSLSSSPIIGVGPGNFIDAFTNFKPQEFNNTSLWNIRFTNSSNFIFYLGTTTGIIGLIAYLSVLIIFLQRSLTVLRNYPSLEKSIVLSLIAILTLQFLFPATFLIIAVFLILLAILENSLDFGNKPSPPSTQNLQPVLTIPLTLFSLIFLFYSATTSYQADIYAQKAAVALKKGDGQTALEKLTAAGKLAPYKENYSIVSSQINLAIAGNIFSKTATVGAKISENDTQLLQEYIKTSISDAKKSTELSPRRTNNWENLAKIYIRVANIVQNALPWIISSYEKAIETDPNNPRLLVDMGGVYFGNGQYATASALFKKATGLKADYNNAHYNLAHALFKLKDYENAVLELDKAITLTNPSSPDYARAKAELALFIVELERKKTALANPQIPQTPIVTPTSNLSLAEIARLMNLSTGSPSAFSSPSSSGRRILIREEGLNIATDSSLPATSSPLSPYVTPIP